MVRLFLFIMIFYSAQSLLPADELYTWASGKLKTPLLYADPEEFYSRFEVATKNDRLAIDYKIGQHIPLFTYENDLLAFGVGGIVQYGQEYLDKEGQGLGLDITRSQFRNGGYIEGFYSKFSLRLPVYYETNTLFESQIDRNYLAVFAPSVHYELVPDFVIYGGAKFLLNSSLQNNKDRFQTGFQYTFGRGYFRPHFGLDYILRENIEKKGRISLRFGSWVGRLDEFVTHSIFFSFELGLRDIGQDSLAYEKVLSFNYSLHF